MHTTWSTRLSWLCESCGTHPNTVSVTGKRSVGQCFKLFKLLPAKILSWRTCYQNDHIIYTKLLFTLIKKMWPLIVRFGKFGKYITLPFVAVIGFVGYNVEGWVSDRYTPSTTSITQQRQERLLENINSSTTKKKHDPLEVNLSPSLST